MSLRSPLWQNPRASGRWQRLPAHLSGQSSAQLGSSVLGAVGDRILLWTSLFLACANRALQGNSPSDGIAGFHVYRCILVQVSGIRPTLPCQQTEVSITL